MFNTDTILDIIDIAMPCSDLWLKSYVILESAKAVVFEVNDGLLDEPSEVFKIPFAVIEQVCKEGWDTSDEEWLVNLDCCDCDAILQLAVFKEVVYA